MAAARRSASGRALLRLLCAAAALAQPPAAKVAAQPALWHRILSASETSVRPTARSEASFTYCPGIDKAIVYGGVSIASAQPSVFNSNANANSPDIIRNDIWMLNYAPTLSWVQLTNILSNSLSSTGAKGRARHKADVVPSTAFPAGTDFSTSCHIVVSGGSYFQSGSTSFNNVQTASAPDDLFVVSVTSYNGTWNVQIATVQIDSNTSPNIPAPRSNHVLLTKGSKTYLFTGDIEGQNVKTSNDAMAKMDIYSLQLQATVGVNQDGLPAYSFAGVWSLVPLKNPNQPPARRYASAASFPTNSLIALYGGESFVDIYTWGVLSDFWIFDVDKSIWTLINGIQVKNTMSVAAAYNNYFIWIGGSTREVSSPTDITTYVYSNAVFTNVTQPDYDKIPTPVASCGNRTLGSLWCVMTLSPQESYDPSQTPGPRMAHAALVRNNQVMIFAGEFQMQYSDVWALDVNVGFNRMQVLTQNYIPDYNLNTTLYFVIGILALLVSGFIVFLVNLRRRGMSGEQASPFQFHANNNNQQINVGARRSLIGKLPMKTYVKSNSGKRKSSKASEVAALIPANVTGEGATIVTNLSPSDKKDSTDDRNDKPASSSTSTSDNNNKPESEKLQEDDESLHDLCPICLIDYEDGEQLKVLPCNHYFHPTCVDQWLLSHNACPMCKRPIDFMGFPSSSNQNPTPESNNQGNPDNNTTVTVAVNAAPPIPAIQYAEV